MSVNKKVLFFNFVFLLFCFCCLCPWAKTAEPALFHPPDPYVSLHPTDVIVQLAQLRSLLEQKPNDLDLLGRALMCYVTLSLNGEAETEGRDGPWLDYAKLLYELRVKLRASRPSYSLAEALPDLWYRAIIGYSAEVDQQLAQWPQEKESESYRALVTLTRNDTRSFRQQNPQSVHARYACVRACIANGLSNENRTFLSLDEKRHNPVLVANLQYRMNVNWRSPEIIISETIAFTVWIMASQDLSNEDAIALLKPLAKALNITPSEPIARITLWRAVYQAALDLRDHDDMPVQAYAAAVLAAEQLAQRSKGAQDDKGNWRFYGLGDIALFARDRLYDASFHAYMMIRQRKGKNDFLTADQAFAEKMRVLAPHSFITAKLGIGEQGPLFYYSREDKIPPERWSAFADVCQKLVEQEHGQSHGVIVYALSELAYGRPQKARELLLAHLSHLGDIPRLRLKSLIYLHVQLGTMSELMPTIEYWLQQAPMDQDLLIERQKWSPKFTLYDNLPDPPAAEWIDKTVNVTKLPIPTFSEKADVTIIWQGFLQITTPGLYTISVECADSSRLIVDDVVVNNMGYHNVVRKDGNKVFAAGWYPLLLEYFNGTGKATCRLLWKAPGATAFLPIPAEVLFQSEHGAPGLQAKGYRKSHMYPATTFTKIQVDQYLQWTHLPSLQYAIGERFFDCYQRDQALPFYRNAYQESPRTYYGMPHYGMRLAQAYLYQKIPDIDAALPILANGADLWNEGWQIGYTTHFFRKAGRIEELYQASVKSQSNDSLWPYVAGYRAFDNGDLSQALIEFEKIFGPGKSGGRTLDNFYYKIGYVEYTILSRVRGSEPDWKTVAETLTKRRSIKNYQLSIDYVSGNLSENEAIAAIPANGDGTEVIYFIGLVAFTQGDFDKARKYFQDFIARRPDDTEDLEADSCHQLIALLNKQTPESRAELAKKTTAPPLPRVAIKNKPTTGATGANDF